MIDTASESGKATRVNVIHNDTDVCNRAHILTIIHSGDIFFIDVDARKIGKLLEGSITEYTIGSEGQLIHDGYKKTAVFVQPAVLGIERHSLYLTDAGAGTLKLICPTKPIASFMKHDN